MFKKSGTREKLIAKIAEANDALAKLEVLAPGEQAHYPSPYRKEREPLQKRLLYRQQALEHFESNIILKKAERLALEVPNATDKPDWWDDNRGETPEYAVVHWLTETGRRGVSKLIKEERKRNVEWWAKIVTPLLGILISLLGLTVALISVLISARRR